MMRDLNHLIRRSFANLLDTGLEISGGILGSYFGMMVAALLESAKESEPAQLQSSMWSGVGFGFLFWVLAISFINRVLIQGLSRASIGKKVFGLELVSVAGPITWGTVIGRWIMGFGSFALGGSGFIYAFFDKDGRTFHDLAANTDVVAVGTIATYVTKVDPAPLSVPVAQVQHRKPNEEALQIFDFPTYAAMVTNVIPFPEVKTKVASALAAQTPSKIDENASLAQVIQIQPRDEDKTATTEEDTDSQAA
jgi:uncharacterized RDD family membrane protein YckC